MAEHLVTGGRAMTTVRHLLREKGSAVWSISPDSMVYDALKLMADKACIADRDFMIKQLESYITGGR
jgi:hypothetical protein